MAEFDIRCVNCFHRSHEDKPCPYCPAPTPDNPNTRCTEFVRADLFIARSMARIEGFLQQSHGQMMMAMSTVFDLLAEAYPEAAISLQKKLEERQEASRLEMEAQQALVRAEADSALKEAREEEEAKAMDELADGYGKVLQFPSNSPADLMGCDPAPEVI